MTVAGATEPVPLSAIVADAFKSVRTVDIGDRVADSSDFPLVGYSIYGLLHFYLLYAAFQFLHQQLADVDVPDVVALQEPEGYAYTMPATRCVKPDVFGSHSPPQIAGREKPEGRNWIISAMVRAPKSGYDDCCAWLRQAARHRDVGNGMMEQQRASYLMPTSWRHLLARRMVRGSESCNYSVL